MTDPAPMPVPLLTERLVGKTVIVTGGARGMGAAHARRLVAEGAHVVLTDLRDDAGEELAASLGEHARQVHADVTSEHDWADVVRIADETYGPIGGLINNAAVLESGTVETTTLEQFQRITDALQTSVFLGMQAVVPALKKHRGGAILNVSATGGLVGFRNIFA